MSSEHKLMAILPCNDLDASEAFYIKLGFKRKGWDDEYRILSDEKGAEIHLTRAVKVGSFLVAIRSGCISTQRE